MSDALVRVARVRLDSALRRLDESIEHVKAATGIDCDYALSRFLDARQAALDTMREVRDLINQQGASS